jgi:ankyrin repeat protein
MAERTHVSEMPVPLRANADTESARLISNTFGVAGRAQHKAGSLESTLSTGTTMGMDIDSASDKLIQAAGNGMIYRLNDILSFRLFASASLSEALFHAVRGKQVAAVRILLSHGANVHACRGEQTVLNCLFDHLDAKEDLEMLGVLLEHIDRRIKDREFNHHQNRRHNVVPVCNNEGLSVVRKLLQNIDSDGVPSKEIMTAALHHALLERPSSLTPSAIHQLLFMGANLNLKLGEAQTFTLQHAARTNLPETLGLLIQLGADVHLTDVLGNSALHVAAYHRNVDVIRLLVKAGAMHDEPNHSGNTAQYVCLKATQNAFERRFPEQNTAKDLIDFQGGIWKSAQNLLFGISPLGSEDPMHVTWEPADQDCYRELPMPSADIDKEGIHSARG